jgi:hypothetical protein
VAIDRATIMKRQPLMSTAPLTRRATLGIGLSAATTGFLPDRNARAQALTADELDGRFLRWSRTATGFADLSAASARKFLELLVRTGISRESLFGLEPDFYRATAIERRLLEAWYTGLLGSDPPGVRNHETTLMWRAAGLDPAPTACEDGPARWASAPSGI